MSKYLHYVTAGIMGGVVGIYHPASEGAFWFILLAAFAHAAVVQVTLTNGGSK
jgi:hypothetical protein